MALTPERAALVASCVNTKGCEHLKCMGVPHPCWTGSENPVVDAKWDVSQPSRGLGDVVAKITHYTGIKKIVDMTVQATGGKPGGCGCAGRQESLNAAVPFTKGE